MKYRYKNTETIVESDHALDSATFTAINDVVDIKTEKEPIIKKNTARKTTAKR